MGKHLEYDRQDIEVLRMAQNGQCTCGAPLFPDFYVRPKSLRAPVNHPCNIELICAYCHDMWKTPSEGDKRDG